MVIKDWMLDAANEIADKLYVPYFAKTIHDIIAMHSPFKPDVAYMPVPRCETCHWWIREGRDYGFCQMSSVDETILGLPPVVDRNFGSRDLRAVRTRDCFGCVQWKEKP